MKTVNGLPDPYPKAPNKAAKYELRVKYKGQMKMLLLFAEAYSALAFINRITHWRRVKVKTIRKILLDNGVTIICKAPKNGMKDLLNYKMSAAEKQFEVTAPYAGYVTDIVSAPTTWGGEEPDKATTDAKGLGKAEKAVKAAAPPPTDTTGMIPIKDLSFATPQKIRAAARKLHWTKPKGGWCFTKEQIEILKSKVK